MNCPNCNKPLTHLNVVSLGAQRVELDEKGKITGWGLPEMMETQFAECTNCQAEIPIADDDHIVIE